MGVVFVHLAMSQHLTKMGIVTIGTGKLCRIEAQGIECNRV